MDPITLIVTALGAGASAGAVDGLKSDVREAAKAAYGRLHDLAKRRFRGNASAEVVLAEYRADPETYKAPLIKKLAETDAGDDADLVAAAGAFMEFLDQQGAKSGKYNVTIKDSKGVQIGDGNLQINKF
jgi:RIP homotypic interaction motif (RHIM)-containing protein